MQFNVWTRPKCVIKPPFPTDVLRGDMEHDTWVTCYVPLHSTNTLLTLFEVTNMGNIMVNSRSNRNQADWYATFTAADYGREFLCEAEFNTNDIRTCSIIPYKPLPVLTLDPDEHLPNTNGTTITCNNTGTSTDDTYYKWYIEDILVDNSVELSVHSTSTGSTLFFDNYIWPSNSVKVTCMGVIPEVVSVNESLVIIIDAMVPTSSESVTTMSNNQSSVTNAPASSPLNLITIVAIAAGGFLAIMLIIILVCIIKRSCPSSKTDKDQIEMTDVTNDKQTGTQNGIDKNEDEDERLCGRALILLRTYFT